jgi:ubiquinone/menaquinone biosynthesis C-methylase UbiE
MGAMSFISPEVAATHFHLRVGDRVADFGAGSGHFVRALSRGVGLDGKVFAIEIQKQLARAIADTATKEKLSNVESIWGDLEALGGTKLPDKTLDLVLISNTLSMLEDKQTPLKEAHRVLRKGGKLCIIDWSDGMGEIKVNHSLRMSESEIKGLVEGLGFVFEKDFPGGAHHYGLTFRAT